MTFSDPVLPFDLFHLVIQVVVNSQDKPTLKRCSLVCRVFRALSQTALFTSKTAPYPFFFVKTLKNAPHRHIANYFRSLTLHWANTDVPWRNLDASLSDVLPLMANVRNLSLDAGGAHWDYITGALNPGLLDSLQAHIFPFITNLRLSMISSLPFSILACPNLEVLTLESVKHDDNDQPGATNYPHPLGSLCSLVLIDCEPESFHPEASLMRLLSCSRAVKSLVLNHPSILNSPVFEPFASLYKQSLQFLDAGSLFCELPQSHLNDGALCLVQCMQN